MAAASFAQVLDDVLGAAAARPAPARAAWTASPGIADPSAFVFARPIAAGQAWARAYPRPAAGAPFTAPAAAPVVPPITLSAGSAPCHAPVAEVAARPVPPAGPTSTVSSHAAPAAPSCHEPRSAAAPPAPPAARRPSPFVPSRRVLSVKEQRALDRLLLLGARLDDHFSADDLRREYRKLALRLHPDRHATAPAGDRAALAEAFARATASYRCLQAVPEPRA